MGRVKERNEGADGGRALQRREQHQKAKSRRAMSPRLGCHALIGLPLAADMRGQIRRWDFESPNDDEQTFRTLHFAMCEDDRCPVCAALQMLELLRLGISSMKQQLLDMRAEIDTLSAQLRLGSKRECQD